MAIVILAIGLLALASTVGWSARTVRQGWESTIMVALAEQELAAFHGRPCVRNASGERVRGPFRLEWRVERPENANQVVVVTVGSNEGNERKADTFSSVIPC